MPPKKTTKKTVAASKTKEAAKAIPTSAQTNNTTTAGVKRGRAESLGSQPASESKKKKADHPPIVHEISDSEVEEIPPPKESVKTRAIDKATKIYILVSV
ncbi:hypothetical protein JR316_0001312 [Psilocybe cubensis]|uniref:Uncharacterized protein n=2 Tax=Psilocybe cubensis TaxID=181762 RepID=A0A8H7YB54_PSICU|nr:hypothetical protein JR316_0001312 [Psilocybe cubensis]KAH9487243.1 hypothetical protein JR316_0001312 [Psilocybe cubensis]